MEGKGQSKLEILKVVIHWGCLGNPFPPQFLQSNPLRRGKHGKVVVEINFSVIFEGLPHTLWGKPVVGEEDDSGSRVESLQQSPVVAEEVGQSHST